MRMRKKKNGAKRMVACSDIIIDKSVLSNSSLGEIFNNNREVRLEVGCGKGTFICELAKKNPNVNFVAMEKVSDVLLLAAEKIKKENLENVRFISGDAKELSELFDSGSISTLYLNFSDPWPKKGHAKRRLTYSAFLEIYKKILVADGKIEFKTDNRQLFDFSLEQFAMCSFELSELTFDLHNSVYKENNIVTEYEANFSAKGFAINRVVAKK